MPDESLKELWVGIRSVIIADADILALLPGDSPAENVIYEEGRLPAQPGYPFIRMWLVGEYPNTGLSGFGDSVCRVQIDVFGTVKSTNWYLARKLQRILDVPRVRTQGIACNGFRVRKMLCRDTSSVGGTGVKISEHEVQQLALDFEVTLSES